MATDVKKLVQLVDYLTCQRQPWDSAWRQIKDNVRPVRPWSYGGNGSFQETGLSDLISDKINDNAAGRAVRILSSGLHSGLTPPSRQWFCLRMREDELMESGPVRKWLYKVEKIVYSAFARSNFYPSIHAVYGDLAAFCSGCMSMEGRAGQGLRFSDIPIGHFTWGADQDGKINTVARSLRIPAGELVAQYGEDAVHQSTRETAKREPYKSIEVMHLVMPRHLCAGGREHGKIDKLNKAYASFVYETGTHHLVDEGGYESFPYLCARWDVLGGEIYGRGAGFDVLPDVKMLQSVAKDQAEAMRMQIKPPMAVPASLKGRLYLIPGAINHMTNGDSASVRPLYNVRPDIPAASAKIADLRQAIKEGYFNDLFLMLAQTNKNMTATEVAERNSEKLLMLGPVIERHQTDILDPCISRAYELLYAMGAIPEPPEELQGSSLNIEFVSILAQAQKLSQATAIRKIVADVGGMARLNPEVLDKLDLDQAVEELSNIEGVPASVIRSRDDVAALRQQRAEQQEQAEQQAQVQAINQQAMEGMQTMSQTNTGPGNLLGDMLSGLAGDGDGAGNGDGPESALGAGTSTRSSGAAGSGTGGMSSGVRARNDIKSTIKNNRGKGSKGNAR